jgi:hypothetical protein
MNDPDRNADDEYPLAPAENASNRLEHTLPPGMNRDLPDEGKSPRPTDRRATSLRFPRC